MQAHKQITWKKSERVQCDGGGVGYQVRPTEKEEVKGRVFYAHAKQITWKK